MAVLIRLQFVILLLLIFPDLWNSSSSQPVSPRAVVNNDADQWRVAFNTTVPMPNFFLAASLVASPTSSMPVIASLVYTRQSRKSTTVLFDPSSASSKPFFTSDSEQLIPTTLHPTVPLFLTQTLPLPPDEKVVKINVRKVDEATKTTSILASIDLPPCEIVTSAWLNSNGDTVVYSTETASAFVKACNRSKVEKLTSSVHLCGGIGLGKDEMFDVTIFSTSVPVNSTRYGYLRVDSLGVWEEEPKDRMEIRIAEGSSFVVGFVDLTDMSQPVARVVVLKETGPHQYSLTETKVPFVDTYLQEGSFAFSQSGKTAVIADGKHLHVLRRNDSSSVHYVDELMDFFQIPSRTCHPTAYQLLPSSESLLLISCDCVYSVLLDFVQIVSVLDLNSKRVLNETTVRATTTYVTSFWPVGTSPDKLFLVTSALANTDFALMNGFIASETGSLEETWRAFGTSTTFVQVGVVDKSVWIVTASGESTESSRLLLYRS